MKQAKLKATFDIKPMRHRVLVGSILLVFGLLAVRAAYIQVIAPESLIDQSDRRTVRTLSKDVSRGLIVDRNDVELAVSIPVKAIWADPKIVSDSDSLRYEKRWQAMADVLGLDAEQLMQRIRERPTRRFAYIQRKVSPAIGEFVQKLKIDGVYLRDESRRYYPAGEVSAHVVGFTDIDDRGLEGVERIYNDMLQGNPGKRTIRRDAKGRQVEILEQEMATKPQNIQLAIDQRIQALAYRELKMAVRYYRATSASLIVSDVATGEILALVNSPSFNPNNRRGVEPHRFRNRAVTDTYEPGSTVKPLAVLSALEFGSADFSSEVDTSPGWMRFGGRRFSDARNFGVLDLAGVLKHSSNVGVAKLALSVPTEFWLDTLFNVGFGNDTGTGLPGESMGILNETRRWSNVELAASSRGYGLSVTPLQLIRMYNTLANGGISRDLSILKRDSVPMGGAGCE